MERIGLFGGTFDPPHIGHLILASVIAGSLKLDTVWFVPVADPPHKKHRMISSVVHRLAMLELALADNPLMRISRIDIDRPGPHYTADMVALASQQAQDSALFFLMGSDSLRDLPSWHNPQQLLEVCHLAVLRRPGVALSMSKLYRILPALEHRMVFVDGPGIDLASSSIARCVRDGHSIQYLVPESVRTYIIEQELYR
jgi:nicotinate-nucleotide adenylyltransferase